MSPRACADDLVRLLLGRLLRREELLLAEVREARVLVALLLRLLLLEREPAPGTPTMGDDEKESR